MNISIKISTSTEYWGDVTDAEAVAASKLLAEKLTERAEKQWPEATVTACTTDNQVDGVDVDDAPGGDEWAVQGQIEDWCEGMWVDCLREVADRDE